MLAKLQVWTAIIGAIGLTAGMWLYYVKPFELNETFTLVTFIVGGSIMLLSFLLFFRLTLMKTEDDE